MMRAASTSPQRTRSSIVNLRDTGTGQAGIVAENAAEMLLVRKYLILHRQVYACAVDQVNDRQAIFHSDFLGAQVLFSGNGKPGAGFYSGIVGYHDALPPLNIPDHHHHTAGRTAAVFLVEFITGERADLDAFRAMARQEAAE